MNGLTNNTRQRAVDTRPFSVSILVEVTEPVVEGKTIRTIVDFPASSAKLTNPTKRQLDALVKWLPATSKNVVRFDSFAGSRDLADKVIALSGTRAKSVERYLRSIGVRGKYEVNDGATTVGILSTYIPVRVTGPANKPVNKLNNQQDAVRAGIQFDAYSAALAQSAKRQLDTLVKRLPAKSNNFVRIVGFVSPAGFSE